MNEFQENLHFSTENNLVLPSIKAITVKPEVHPHQLFSIQKNMNPFTSFNERRKALSFRGKLTDLMLFSIQCWEFSTNLSQLELAEQSGIWKITIDDGRLRTRSLDRYLSIKKIPKNPRWRQVIRTARFVLGECKLEPIARNQLSDKLQAVIQHIREEALA